MSLETILKSKKAAKAASEAHWIPLSDLMTGLMMMFVLIAVIFMLKVEEEAGKVKTIALTYEKNKDELYQALSTEFNKDLPAWGAELSPDLTVRFKEPNVLFDVGQDTLKPRFVEILGDFFPRYVHILSSPQFKDTIEEIRIEGHTSSIWSSTTTEDAAYFLNMGLSQARTRSALQYVIELPKVADQKQWLKSHLTANGLSSSKPIYLADKTEDKAGSQRVEFRVRTNAEQKIDDILRTVKQ